MKKTYKKPLLLIENFKLSENIAACDPSFGNNSNITLEDIEKAYNVLGYFANDTCKKGEPIENEPVKVFNGMTQIQLCYHGSTGLNVFSS